MKFGKKTMQPDSGSVLVTALILSAVLGLVLASFLTLLVSRNTISHRSEAWNQAVPVLEAGLEEAFTHLHDDAALTNNGWTAQLNGGNLVYQKRRDFTNDSAYCLMTISNAPAAPVIYSTGYVLAPVGTNYISRQVRVATTNPVVFTKAIAAKGAITLGGGATVDSFNSANPLYSTNGMYIASLREANGSVVTDSTANPAINVGTANVYGKVDTGPGGTVSTSGPGSVGGLGWGSGIEPGWSSGDMNVTFPDQAAPSGWAGWLAPVSGSYSVGGTNYTYKLGSGGYTLNGDFSMSGGNSLVVSGNATLYVTGNISVAGQSFIYLAPGASLSLVGGGSTTKIAGGGVVNGTGRAASFSYIGLPANTSVSYTGGSAFIGTVNAPEAAFKIAGGSAMVGAAIVNTFDGTGGAGLHFDESLGGNGLLTMLSYTEL
jgi:hypothetical protein